MTNQQKFNALARSTKRSGIEELLQYLETIEFFNAPASTKYHLSIPGGLVIHSINVAEFMLNECKKISTVHDISYDSIVISALFHDVGKAKYFGKQMYIPNYLDDPETQPQFMYNKSRLNVMHEIVSLQIVSKFINLNEEETFAILYHNGLYSPLGESTKGKEQKLQQLLHFSDMWSSRFLE
jgi:23S rRNA maturation-related 3'-5' exoribonuclease YhaM